MQYLVIFREDPRLSAAIPPPILIEMVLATGDWLGDVKLSGQATETAFMSGEHGGFAIFNAESGGQLADLIESCPSRAFCSVETIPLMTAAEAKSVQLKSQARIGEMMQKMATMAGAH
jgi:muconolactone delta-isomerase